MTDRPKPKPILLRSPPSTPGGIATSAWDHSRRYAIYRGNELIGTTNLEYPILHGERAAGQFYPAWLFRKYEAVFQLYATATDASALRRYKRQLDALGLQIWDRGALLDARVELISAWSSRKWMVHVHIKDPRYWTARPLS